MKGRDALKITWDDGPNKNYDSEAYKAQMEASVKAPGKVERNEGDVDKALASAAKVVTAEYYTRTSRTRRWSRRQPSRA